MSRDISNSEDILDSRDVIARRDELQEEQQDLIENFDEDAPETEETICETRAQLAESLLDWWKENGAELEALNDFIDEGSNEWRHGETLVRESYFEDYARELAEETGAINTGNPWPLNCIDWEQAARELRMDYTGADFDGVTYYYRS